MISENTVASQTGTVIINSLSKWFDTIQVGQLLVLDDIDLTINSGEFHTIVGPSGCGKTTLLRIMKGLDTYNEGSVIVNGQLPKDVKAGFVFQRASLLPWRTIKQNVAFGTSLAQFRKSGGGDRKASNERVTELLSLTGLSAFANYYPSQISGGMQQRANLARALAIEPNILLMDEPFSALDAQTKERLQRELQEIVCRIGTTTVFITHDIREAAFLSDRVSVMSSRPGRIVQNFELTTPRPRTTEFQQSDELAGIARDIWHALHGASDATSS